jgi:hypothetical protein
MWLGQPGCNEKAGPSGPALAVTLVVISYILLGFLENLEFR